ARPWSLLQGQRPSQERVQADAQPGRKLWELLEREENTVRERLARCRVVTDRQQLSLAAEDHFLVCDESWEPYRVDVRAAADQIRRRTCGPGRCVFLRLTVQFDDLRTRKVLRRLFGEAHHQHGTKREVRGDEEAQASLAGV